MLPRWRAFSMSAPQTGDRSRVDALPRTHIAFLARVMATFSLQYPSIESIDTGVTNRCHQ